MEVPVLSLGILIAQKVIKIPRDKTGTSIRASALTLTGTKSMKPFDPVVPPLALESLSHLVTSDLSREAVKKHQDTALFSNN